MVELTRRGFLGAVGAGVLLPAAVRVPAAAAAPGALSGFGAGRALRAAMHVHGSWSEGTGSWQAQFQQAAAGGYDLLYLTDHDIRMLARGYLTSLSGVALAGSSTGTFAQKAATASGGGLRLLAESASATAAAAATLTLPEAMAKSALRTSISGFTIRQTVTRATLSGGATYEITVPLSYHPATGGRPAGQYTIVYRFGGTAGRSVQGLTGTVSAPAPAAGAVLTLSPETDAAALWPDLLAIDNGAAGLSFTARSPHRGAVADVTIGSTTFARARSTAAAVIADQARVVAAYQPQHPGLTARASTEVSISHPHANPFGLPQWLPDYGSLPTAHDAQYRAIVDQVHAGGGVISWNHPFGDDNPPLLAPAARDTKRRQVFADMLAVDLFGMDVVEVGYNSRGGVDAATHLALWDTFSRAGRFLTGNGTSDDHSGKGCSDGGPVHDLGHERVGLDRTQRQAARDRVVRRDPLAGVQRDRRALPAHHGGHEQAARGFGNHTERHERGTQAGALRDVDDVAVQQHGQADAHAEAVDRREQRLLERGDGVDEPRESRTGVVGPARRARIDARHLAEVLPGRERATGAGEDDARDVVPRARLVERGRARVVERRVERIESVRTVQREDPDAVSIFDFEVAQIPSHTIVRDPRFFFFLVAF